MKVTEFRIKGPKLIEPKIHGDARGFFTERYREDLFRELELPTDFVQDNYSRSTGGVLRGLHYQYDRPQAKLVTVAVGRILDVVVDIRKDSPTYGQSLSVEIDGGKPTWFWVPAGFAHGFLVLSQEGADLMYKVDSYYNASGEGGIRWNDPALRIEWPIKDPKVSPRDADLPLFETYNQSPRF
jgi:dTDP-4-dehydrorhamnose 3,5-epimerase